MSPRIYGQDVIPRAYYRYSEAILKGRGGYSRRGTLEAGSEEKPDLA